MARERQVDGPQPRDTDADESRAIPSTIDAGLESFVSTSGPALTRGDALLLLSETNAAAARLDVRQAEDRYTLGERLVKFASGRGHVALGHPNLARCLAERFGLGRSWAYETMRFARLATRKDVTDMPWAVARLGVELCGLTGATSFQALAKKPLPVPSADGAPVHFPASVEQLEAAVALLTASPKKDDDAEEDEDEIRAVEATAAKRAQAVVDTCLAEWPSLAEARPRVYVHGGRAHVKLAAVELRGDTFAAVRHLFDALEKSVRRR